MRRGQVHTDCFIQVTVFLFYVPYVSFFDVTSFFLEGCMERRPQYLYLPILQRYTIYRSIITALHYHSCHRAFSSFPIHWNAVGEVNM